MSVTQDDKQFNRIKMVTIISQQYDSGHLVNNFAG